VVLDSDYKGPDSITTFGKPLDVIDDSSHMWISMIQKK